MDFRIPIAAAIVGFSAAIVPGSVSAEVIVFSNFGPGDSFDQSQFWGINGPTSSFQHAVALPFSPLSTTILSRAEFAAEHFGNDPSITFTVFADNSGEPGILLDTITLGSFTDGIVSADFSGGAVLMAGNTYWGGVFSSTNGDNGWNRTGPPAVTGDLASTLDGGSTWTVTSGQDQGAFRISGVPEPSQTALAICIGLAVVGSRMLRKR